MTIDNTRYLDAYRKELIVKKEARDKRLLPLVQSYIDLGYSMKGIADALNAHGETTLTGKAYSRTIVVVLLKDLGLKTQAMQLFHDAIHSSKGDRISPEVTL